MIQNHGRARVRVTHTVYAHASPFQTRPCMCEACTSNSPTAFLKRLERHLKLQTTIRNGNCSNLSTTHAFLKGFMATFFSAMKTTQSIRFFYAHLHWRTSHRKNRNRNDFIEILYFNISKVLYCIQKTGRFQALKEVPYMYVKKGNS